MTNFEKTVELVGKQEAEFQLKNGCPWNMGMILKRNCNDECQFCWEEEFYALPICFEECTCETCQKYEEVCCANKTNYSDLCMNRCPLLQSGVQNKETRNRRKK